MDWTSANDEWAMEGRERDQLFSSVISARASATISGRSSETTTDSPAEIPETISVKLNCADPWPPFFDQRSVLQRQNTAAFQQGVSRDRTTCSRVSRITSTSAERPGKRGWERRVLETASAQGRFCSWRVSTNEET